MLLVDLEKLNKIKRVAIIALFSDDDLMDCLVLKGGNALDIVYDIADRASLDLDFSMDKSFPDEEVQVVERKIRNVLTETFRAHGFEAFDIRFKEVPESRTVAQPAFWGGYQVEFKVMESLKFAGLQGSQRSLRVNAIEVGPEHERRFKISISKQEYCAAKQRRDLDFFTVYVYTPEMIVFEKLRAICQQMPDYTVNTTPTARARDFFDIYTVMQHFRMDLAGPGNGDMLRAVFDAKKVPLTLLGKVRQFRDYHSPDFASVKATVKPDRVLKDFDFYFDFIVQLCESLKPLWVV
jgi:predicted nucleotidyltransferase component of viral defense system